MAKEFNTSVTCNPQRHYMVDVTAKMKVFEALIDQAKYFTINRARQFGKSSALKWILWNMSDRYLVIPTSFEKSSAEDWISTDSFCKFFCKKIIESLIQKPDYQKFWLDVKDTEKIDFDILSSKITEFCKLVKRKVVLTIDEVDQSLNNELFIRFLALLRNMYINRDNFNDESYTFWSVILAGVYDIKNLQTKIRPEREHKYNSPWNVAAKYNLDMTFNPLEISTMLADYESDYHIGFNINEISEEIYKYTSGYPGLVSAVCKEIDEHLGKDWTKDGVQKAAKIIIKEKSTLTESITEKLEALPDLKQFIRALVLESFVITFEANNPTMSFANMFSIIKEGKNGKAEIHNLIFQQVLTNYFIAEKTLSTLRGSGNINIFIDQNGDIDMPLVVDRFFDTLKTHRNDEEFIEKQGRLLFLCFLKPIINGTGFYYIEPENEDESRMDLIINYNRKEYIVELKIWRGTKYEIEGKEQLSNYLTQRNLTEGYLVTFSFLKNKVIQEQPEWVDYNGKRIYEAII